MSKYGKFRIYKYFFQYMAEYMLRQFKIKKLIGRAIIFNLFEIAYYLH